MCKELANGARRTSSVDERARRSEGFQKKSEHGSPVKGEDILSVETLPVVLAVNKGNEIRLCI